MPSPAHSQQQPRSSESPDLSGLMRSVSRPHGWEPLRVEGELPPQLRGTVVRTGPGLLERFGRRLAHTFEADGALTAVRLDGRGAHGAVRILESPGYREEQAAGKPLYGSVSSRWRRVVNGLRGRVKATGNTNVMHWQGQTYALMEGARPLQVDTDTLAARDTSDLGGTLGATFSAHPHRVQSLRTTFNFGQVWGPRPGLRLYALPDEGPAKDLGFVEIPFNTMVHDFAVTERHMVFVVCPAKLRLRMALTAHPDFSRYFSWDPSSDAELIVVPIDDPGQSTRLPLPARWVFHLCNAHDRAGELVVDWVQYPDFSVFSALAGQDEPDGASRARTVSAPPHVQRVVVDLRARKIRSDEVLWRRGCDFPVLPAGRVGQPYPTCWFAVADSDRSGGVARFEPETGATDTWQPGPGHAVSEALLVPAAGATRDDEGWLLPLVLDGWARESYLAVLDAARPSAGPVAKVWMGQALPVTFHGTFMASADSTAR